MVDLGRFENTSSWVFMISRAAAAEETTRTGLLPKRSSMSGPCFREREWREWWAKSPSWWRFPMIGSRGGDGGECGGVVERRLRRSVRGRRERRRESNKNNIGLKLLFESLFVFFPFLTCIAGIVQLWCL